MNRTEILNLIINKYNLNAYLEVGVNTGVNWAAIKVPFKVGVDPDKNSRGTTHYLPSDEYFAKHNDKFDIAFIDGLHENEQCYRDIVNALDRLNEGGFIVCHDMNPPSFAHQHVPRLQKEWNGDVWKAWVKLRRERKDLSMFVVDCDWGCGVIYKGSQNELNTSLEINYKNFDNNRKEWLNLITVEEFKRWISE